MFHHLVMEVVNYVNFMCLLRNSINHRNSEKHWVWASLYSDHLWSHRIPAFHQDLLTFGRFRHRRTESRGEFPHSRRLKQQQYSAIATIKNQRNSTNIKKTSSKILKNLQTSTIFLFKNVQKSPNFRKFVRWLVTKIWAFWKTSCKGSSKKKLCNTKPPTKPKSTGNYHGNTEDSESILWCRESHRCPKFIEICIEKAVSQRISDFFYSVFLQDATIAEQSWSFRGRPFENNAGLCILGAFSDFESDFTPSIWSIDYPNKKPDNIQRCGIKADHRFCQDAFASWVELIFIPWVFWKPKGKISTVLFPTEKDCFLKP